VTVAADPTAATVGLGWDQAGEATAVEAFAPGRVNLIGEHTDYSGGLALPMAVHLGTTVTGVRTSAGISVTSDALPGTVTITTAHPTDRSPHPGDDPVVDPTSIEPQWGRYVAGVANELHRLGQQGGLTGTVTTTVPVGAGLSSSAALEIAIALALGFRGTRRSLAHLARNAEQRASGVPCGLMDQLASACGTTGHALRIDFTSEVVTPVPMPPDVEVVVVHSGLARTLAGSAYAQRRQECERAAGLIGPLAQATVDDAETIDDPVLRRRARHVTTENARVDAMVEALAAGDLVGAGALLAASHRSLADDFEVSVPELDALVTRLAATPGVFGARLTGAGFGGCAVALTRPGTLHAAPDVWPVSASAGASVHLA